MKTTPVSIRLSTVALSGDLAVPPDAAGLILFSHGSGSSRQSPRNRSVAETLQAHGFATLLFDLLTEKEDAIYENRFNIDLLTARLIMATRWATGQSSTSGLAVAYFGASTGAASALKAAAVLGDEIKAVVSRGGRPDLVLDTLAKVTAPVLLLVGEKDEEVIELNRQALAALRTEKELVIVLGATHLFEEPGKLAEVAGLAAGWYEKHLAPKPEKTIR